MYSARVWNTAINGSLLNGRSHAMHGGLGICSRELLFFTTSISYTAIKDCIMKFPAKAMFVNLSSREYTELNRTTVAYQGLN